MKFEVKSEFYRDGRPIKLLSGAVHYFRIHPTQWRTTLQNLKSMGFNAVETYVPWNLHEPKHNQFNFEGQLDVYAFIRCAEDLGLMVILRPSPFICAEWEFGGLPAWLLKEDIRVRSADSRFLVAVENYYDHLLPGLVSQQVTHGGSIIMMQVENEYGSYGTDRLYITKLCRMLRRHGVDIPLFTSDGTWAEALYNGNLADQDVLTTGNFGSHAEENFKALSDFHRQNGKHWPLMCMEYWDGWFNRWGEKVVKREVSSFADDISQLLKRGSINLYMFRGGTNFGFMNGCSARGMTDMPQVTSYDYDAPLTEWGAPTEKYYAVQQVVKTLFPEAEIDQPIQPVLVAYGSVRPDGQLGLLDDASSFGKSIESRYPLSFEDLDNYYGYVLYRTQIKTYNHETTVTMVNIHDRVQLYADGALLSTKTAVEVSEPVKVTPAHSPVRLDLLVENQGRVNYGYKLQADSQRKGICGGVMTDHQFQTQWQQIVLPFDETMISNLTFGPIKPINSQPMLMHFSFRLEQMQGSTFIDCQSYGKGIIIVNGVNIGRYWDKGPYHSLYVPEGLLREENEVMVFETEGVPVSSLTFCDHPIIDHLID